jgi:hypothetical protein
MDDIYGEARQGNDFYDTVLFYDDALHMYTDSSIYITNDDGGDGGGGGNSLCN